MSIIDSPKFSWYAEIETDLDKLIRLGDNWDGYFAPHVEFGIASFCLNLLINLCDENTPKPQIVPGVEGDLQIEWHVDDIEIELNIFQPYKALLWTNDESLCPDNVEILLKNDFTIVKNLLIRAQNGKN